ncbi:MAG: hypothetical protein U0P30_12310 [Vicinamibacterales bacterium]
MVAPSAVTADTAAAADGSTLKVSAPTLTGPASGATVDSLRPTFEFVSSAGRFLTVFPTHRLELLSGTTVIDTRTLPAGQTSLAFDRDLEYDTAYSWRLRAELDGAAGPWSALATFRTFVKPVPKVPRADDPPAGQRLPLPGYLAGVMNEQYNSNRSDWASSCQDTYGERGWIWIDKLIDKLRSIDNRWGYNGKRGNINDPSKDVLTYHYAAGESQNSTQVYIIDVMGGHCGNAPTPVINDVTQITLSSGTIGRYTYPRPGRTTPPYF